MMAAPQDALAARAGSSEMEFLVRFGFVEGFVCVSCRRGRRRFVVGLGAVCIGA